MLGILILTPGEVCAYAESIRWTPYKKLTLYLGRADPCRADSRPRIGNETGLDEWTLQRMKRAATLGSPGRVVPAPEPVRHVPGL